MLVHVEIPDMSLNLQDPLLRLTGIHPRQTGGPLFCQILTDFARGGRRANSTPGPARGGGQVVLEKKMFEIVYDDGRTTDGWTPYRPVYYKLTSEPSAQLS